MFAKIILWYFCGPGREFAFRVKSSASERLRNQKVFPPKRVAIVSSIMARNEYEFDTAVRQIKSERYSYLIITNGTHKNRQLNLGRNNQKKRKRLARPINYDFVMFTQKPLRELSTPKRGNHQNDAICCAGDGKLITYTASDYTNHMSAECLNWKLSFGWRLSQFVRSSSGTGKCRRR